MNCVSLCVYKVSGSYSSTWRKENQVFKKIKCNWKPSGLSCCRQILYHLSHRRSPLGRWLSQPREAVSLPFLCWAQSLSRVQLFAIPWTVACQAPLSMGLLQVSILEWVAMPSSRGSSQPRDWTQSPTLRGFDLTQSSSVKWRYTAWLPWLSGGWTDWIRLQ